MAKHYIHKRSDQFWINHQFDFRNRWLQSSNLIGVESLELWSGQIFCIKQSHEQLSSLLLDKSWNLRSCIEIHTPNTRNKKAAIEGGHQFVGWWSDIAKSASADKLKAMSGDKKGCCETAVAPPVTGTALSGTFLISVHVATLATSLLSIARLKKKTSCFRTHANALQWQVYLAKVKMLLRVSISGIRKTVDLSNESLLHEETMARTWDMRVCMPVPRAW